VRSVLQAPFYSTEYIFRSPCACGVLFLLPCEAGIYSTTNYCTEYSECTSNPLSSRITSWLPRERKARYHVASGHADLFDQGARSSLARRYRTVRDLRSRRGRMESSLMTEIIIDERERGDRGTWVGRCGRVTPYCTACGNYLNNLSVN
jgi:hypothetical protein